MTPDYKNKSQTAFGVAIICAGFVLETWNFTRGNPNFATRTILGLLSAVFVGTIVVGIHWHRKYRAALVSD
ncbi:MAG: hypothetical protein U5K74_12795 [Gemmatimonadaceae bacterium]|nr:hypothetical protein [Gemmatimonadaceae bacterium]